LVIIGIAANTGNHRCVGNYLRRFRDEPRRRSYLLFRCRELLEEDIFKFIKDKRGNHEIHLSPSSPSQQSGAKTLRYKCCDEHVSVENGFHEIAL